MQVDESANLYHECQSEQFIFLHEKRNIVKIVQLRLIFFYII